MPEKYFRRSVVLSSVALVSAAFLATIANGKLSGPASESTSPTEVMANAGLPKPEIRTPESVSAERGEGASQAQVGVLQEEKSESLASPGKPSPIPTVEQTRQGGTNESDTDSGVLQQSDWYAQAMDYIEKDQYKIRKTRDGDAAWYRAYNPAQDFIAEFGPEGVTLKPYPKRDYDERDPRELRRRGPKSPKPSSAEPSAPNATSTDASQPTTFALLSVGDTTFDSISANDYTVDEETGIIRLVHGGVTQTWENTSEGLRHRMTVAQAPKEGPLTICVSLVTELGPARASMTRIVDAGGEVVSYTERAVEDRILLSLGGEDSIFPLSVEKTLVGAGNNPQILYGQQPYSSFGNSVSTAGDVNGDGFGDVVVGAPYFDSAAGSDSGKIYLYLGSQSGLLSTPNWTAEGEEAFFFHGFSVSSAGDVNADGYSDVIVGASNTVRFAGRTDFSTGRSYIYFGGSSGLSNAIVLADEKDHLDSGFGASASSAGDVNGDGFGDVIIGAGGLDGEAGVDSGGAYLYLGGAKGVDTSPASRILGVQAGERLGESVSDAGDINGDGFGDVLVGAPGTNGVSGIESGTVNVYLGSTGGLTPAPSFVLFGEQPHSIFGAVVSGGGDVNGDGFCDVLIGAPEFDGAAGEDSGKAYLYLGRADGINGTPIWTQEGEPPPSENGEIRNPASFFGSSLSSAGDVNGDGYDDVIAGAWRYYGGAGWASGKAYLYQGSADGLATTTVWTRLGAKEDSNFGISASTSGDVNGDGFDDVIIGASGSETTTGRSSGMAYVYLGNADGLSDVNEWSVYGENLGTSDGFSIDTAGDVNGDGFSDVIVGVGSYEGRGKVYIYLGALSGLSAIPDWTASGEQPWSQFGRSVSSAGDIDGDGYGDVIVSAPYFDGAAAFESGKVYVYMGSAEGLDDEPAWSMEGAQDGDWSPTPSIGGGFGSSVSGAGDVNGDGFSDIVVSTGSFDGEAGENTGKAYVFVGTSEGLSSVAAWTNEGDFLAYGFHAFGIGDVNGDGYGDLRLDASGAEYYLTKYFLGSGIGLSETPSRTLESDVLFQIDVGDVNDDNYGDTVVRSPYFDGVDDTLLESLSLYLGNEHGPTLTPVWTYVGGQSEYSFYITCRGVGDVNGDGHGDVMVGEFYKHGIAGSRSGSASLFLGTLGGLSHTPAWTGEGQKDFTFFGAGFLDGGDINGDGYGDVIIRALGRSVDDSSFPGEAHVYYGRAFKQLRPDPPFLSISSPGRVLDALTCSVNQPATDSDGVGLQYRYIWNNITLGEAYLEGPISTLYSTLPVERKRKHEVWSCYVQAWNGHAYSQPRQETDAVEILNSLPSAPTVALPAVQSTTANLVCILLEPALDDDLDSIQYDYDWYVQRENEPVASLFRDGAPTFAISDQINNTDTEPGDQWYCVVTPHDGEAYGELAISTTATIVLGGIEPSFVSLALSPASISLGESIAASGNIFPTPLGSTNATFESISPSGVNSGVFPQGTVISGGAYTQIFVPTEASTGRGPWSITASWPGDDTYQAATSAAATFTVGKAQPDLALSVAPNTALLGLANTENFAVTASLSVVDFPAQLRGLLEGRSIEVSVVDGANASQGELTALTNADGQAIFTKADFAAAGITFGMPGVWRFKAAFAGDDNFLSTESADFDDTDARLTIKRGAGYAVVVLGRLDADAEGHREHALTTDFIYRTLLERQFDADDIYYLREYLPELGEAPSEDIDVFDAATEANLAAALTEVRGKMLVSPAPLFIVLVDHGNPDLFYMDDASTPGVQEALTPGELDERLDLLQAAFLENDEAAAQDIVVINGS